LIIESTCKLIIDYQCLQNCLKYLLIHMYIAFWTWGCWNNVLLFLRH